MGAKVPKKASSQAGKQAKTDRQTGRQAGKYLVSFRFHFLHTHTHKQTHSRERRQFSRTTAFPSLAGGDVLFELLLPAAGRKVPRKGSMVNLETHFPTFTVPPVHTNWERFSLFFSGLCCCCCFSLAGAATIPEFRVLRPRIPKTKKFQPIPAPQTQNSLLECYFVRALANCG